MKTKLKAIVSFLQAVFAGFSAHRAPRLAAALAYYALFSTAPLLIIAIAIAASIVGQAAAQDVIIDRVTVALGPAVAEAIGSLLTGIAQPRATILATIISAVVVLVGATNFYAALQDSLNTIWDASPVAVDIKTLARSRGLAFVMVIGTGLILIMFLLLSALTTALAGIIEQVAPGMLDGWTVWTILQGFVFYGLATFVFAVIFRVLPDTVITWRDVWLAAVVTTILFTIGRFLLDLYIRFTSITSIYGAAGSLVALLIFVYYMAQIIFLGAEISRVYAEKYGSRAPRNIPDATTPDKTTTTTSLPD